MAERDLAEFIARQRRPGRAARHHGRGMDPGPLGAAGPGLSARLGLAAGSPPDPFTLRAAEPPLRRGAPPAAPGGLDREKLRPDPAPAPAAHTGVDGAEPHPAGAARGRRGWSRARRDKGVTLMAESLADKKARAGKILTRLAKAYPDAARARLRHALELLVATILLRPVHRRARQHGDAGALPRYPRDRRRLGGGADPAGARARDPLHRLLPQQGQVDHRDGPRAGGAPRRPSARNQEELVELPGVGRKTANVVLGNAFDIPADVDTHVTRVTRASGLARGDDAEKVHDQLWSSRVRAGRRPATCSSSTGGASAPPASRPARPARSSRSARGRARRRRLPPGPEPAAGQARPPPAGGQGS